MPKATKKYGEVIRFRASATEKAALVALAERENMSESDVLRRLLQAETGLPLPVASADRPALGDCAEQLRKIGVNLNQAVRAMNEGRVGYDAAMLKALQLLGDAMVRERALMAAMVKPARSRRGASAS